MKTKIIKPYQYNISSISAHKLVYTYMYIISYYSRRNGMYSSILCFVWLYRLKILLWNTLIIKQNITQPGNYLMRQNNKWNKLKKITALHLNNLMYYIWACIVMYNHILWPRWRYAVQKYNRMKIHICRYKSRIFN